MCVCVCVGGWGEGGGEAVETARTEVGESLERSSSPQTSDGGYLTGAQALPQYLVSPHSLNWI